VDKVTDRERLKEQGVSSYLIKPFNTAELKEGLGRSLITALSQQ
jgi:DNA-binding response OmpR family regulator